jgi:hypothetical protein
MINASVCRDLETYRSQFVSADPFPHVVIDGFFNPEDAHCWMIFRHSTQTMPGLNSGRSAGRRPSRTSVRSARFTPEFISQAKEIEIRQSPAETTAIAEQVPEGDGDVTTILRGSASPEGAVQGFWKDSWISRRFELNLRLTDDLQRIVIEGYLPETMRRETMVHISLKRCGGRAPESWAGVSFHGPRMCRYYETNWSGCL